MIFALPQKTKTIYKLRFLCVVLAVLGVLLCFFERNKVIRAVFYIAFALFVVGFWALHKFLKTYRLEISFDKIVVFYEVIVAVKKICPLSAISYITQFQTPLAKKNKLCVVVLKSTPKSIIIPEMLEKTVLKIQKATEETRGNGD